ncbi:MBL fold metallo-hydrolase [Geodermatophilus sp. FMUSA9-8]|uniref:MBL fold metallo-hydrolase n=1 Tax=Geodermatophilus sp. FMUSA9-8 TaxID=3120155 RepID=UPI00300972BC
MADLEYSRGLHDLGGGCHAWLEPDGSWGWSNAGLVVGDGESLLFDTLFDVPMTRAMLDGMAGLTGSAPIRTVVNSHSNGDHWFGNQLFPDARILTSAATAEEMQHSGPELIMGLRDSPGGPGRFAREIFAPFDWTDCDPLRPTDTFSGRRDLDVGGVEVQLLELGPAHTAGDSVAWVPSAGVLFTGDLLFIGGTPIIWAGPLRNWVRACDTMLALEPAHVVPGHGPVTDGAGIRQVREYLLFVEEEATKRFEAGMDPVEAMHDIALGRFGEWAESGRIAQNVMAVYLELDPTLEKPDTREVFARVATMEGFRD